MLGVWFLKTQNALSLLGHIKEAAQNVLREGHPQGELKKKKVKMVAKIVILIFLITPPHNVPGLKWWPKYRDWLAGELASRYYPIRNMEQMPLFSYLPKFYITNCQPFPFEAIILLPANSARAWFLYSLKQLYSKWKLMLGRRNKVGPLKSFYCIDCPNQFSPSSFIFNEHNLLV